MKKKNSLFQKIINSKSVRVNEPAIPNKRKIFNSFNKIFKSRWLTNHGQYEQKLEKKLKNIFGVKNVILCSNGTSSLLVALKSMNIKGKVITTPFSFPATINSLLFLNLKYEFVDIDYSTLNMDVKKIKQNKVRSSDVILGVHVFGRPCDLEGLEKIKKQKKIKLIYDLSHCFGIKLKNRKNIFNFGDIGIMSFHATKHFHTTEGGAIITNNNILAKKCRQLVNFGFYKDNFVSPGINAKLNEFSSAIGLENLKTLKEIVIKKKNNYHLYKKYLTKKIHLKAENSEYISNFHYLPAIFPNEKLLVKTIKELNKNYIYPRRYFYPSLNKLSYLNNQKNMPNSEKASKRIICLPTHHTLKKNQILKTINIINRILN